MLSVIVSETVQTTVQMPSKYVPDVKFATILSVAPRLELSTKKATVVGFVAI
jgi:hypothetical protein